MIAELRKFFSRVKDWLAYSWEDEFWEKWRQHTLPDLADADEFPADPPEPDYPSYPFHLYLMREDAALPLGRYTTLADALNAQRKYVRRELVNGWQRVACDDPFGALLFRDNHVFALTVIGSADGASAYAMMRPLREWSVTK